MWNLLLEIFNILCFLVTALLRDLCAALYIGVLLSDLPQRFCTVEVLSCALSCSDAQ